MTKNNQTTVETTVKKYENIKGAKELIESLNVPLDEIKQDIAALQAEKTALETELESGANKFKPLVAKKNQKLQQEIGLITQTIADAEQRKNEIIKENERRTYREVAKLINDRKEELRKVKAADNKAMIEKIHEIRAIYAAMQADSVKEISALEELVQDVDQFVSDELVGEYGNNSPFTNLIEIINDRRYSDDADLSMFDVFSQKAYKISGLLVTDTDALDLAEQRLQDEKYNVTTGL